MSVRSVTTCDRCHAEPLSDNLIIPSMTFYTRNANQPTRVDFCNSCAKEFLEFLVHNPNLQPAIEKSTT